MDFVEIAETSLLHHAPELGRFAASAKHPNMLNDNQLLCLAIVGAITSYVSVLASFLLKGMLTRTEKWGSYHRLVMMAALCNALTANFFALSPLFHCTIGGFLMQAGFSSIIYQAMVSVYYWLEVRCGIDKADIAHRYEIWLHLFPLVLGYGIAAMGLPLFGSHGAYSSLHLGLGCWVHRDIFPGSSWFFYGVPFLLTTLLHVGCTASVLSAARQGIRDTAHVVEHQNQGAKGRLYPVVAMSKTEVACAMYAEATECCYFALSSAACYGWMMAVRVVDLLGGKPNDFYWLLLIAHVVYPLYGLFQLFVCLLPDVRKKQDRHPELSTARAMSSAFFRTPSLKNMGGSRRSNLESSVHSRVSLHSASTLGAGTTGDRHQQHQQQRRLSHRAEALIANLAPRRSSRVSMDLSHLEQRRERQRMAAHESQMALDAAAMDLESRAGASSSFSSSGGIDALQTSSISGEHHRPDV